MLDRRIAQAQWVFGEALALWRGDPLVDVVDDQLLEAERVRLTEMRVATLEARIDADLALGRHADFVAELEQLVAASVARASPRRS